MADAEYEKAAKRVGMLEPLAANKAYLDGYNGNTDSLYAKPSNIGVGPALNKEYERGVADKNAGRPSSPKSLAEPVALGGRNRRNKKTRSKKTKKGGRRHKKVYTRRR